MKSKQICAIALLSFAMGWIGTRSVCAQALSQPRPPASVLPLEVALDPSGEVMQPSASPSLGQGVSSGPVLARPAQNGLDYRGVGGNAALGQLSNPFDGGPGLPPASGPNYAAMGSRQAVLPTEQTASGRPVAGRSALKHLRNPFNTRYGQQEPGLFGHFASPQYPAAQGVGAMPGVAPGMVAPGAMAGGPAAGAGGPGITPGEAGAPGAPSPGAAAAPTPARPRLRPPIPLARQRLPPVQASAAPLSQPSRRLR